MIRFVLLYLVQNGILTESVTNNANLRRSHQTSEDKVYQLIDKYVAKDFKSNPSFNKSDVWYGTLNTINNVYQKAVKITKRMNDNNNNQIKKARNKNKKRLLKLRNEQDNYKEMYMNLNKLSNIISDMKNYFDGHKDIDVKTVKILRNKRSAETETDYIKTLPKEMDKLNSTLTEQNTNTLKVSMENRELPNSNGIDQQLVDKQLEDLKINGNETRRMPFKYNKDNNSKGDYHNKLETSLQDLKRKIDPIRRATKLYSKESLYHIGYIMANIDTLYMNLDHIKTNSNNYDENNISNTFDELRNINVTVDNLEKLLDFYMKNLNKGKNYNGLNNNYLKRNNFEN